jgi:hypothetical protein
MTEIGKIVVDVSYIAQAPTNDMIKAGLDVLYQSGLIETQLSSDGYILSDIFQAMINSRLENC